MRLRSIVFDFIAATVTTAIVIYGLQYAYNVYTFDLTTLVVSVILPVCLGALILAATRERILLYAFLAYIWAVVDDMPVYFDSVLTWPEVTRFHPFLPRLLMNIVIHALTLAFLYLAIRESMKGRTVERRRAYTLGGLVLIALVLAYAQNIPLGIVQNTVQNDWYPFDLATKLASIFVLCLAVFIAKSSERKSPADFASKRPSPQFHIF